MMEGFNPNKFIDNLVRLYCKQQNQETTGWKFVNNNQNTEVIGNTEKVKEAK